MAYNVGDAVALRHEVYSSAGVLTNATVVLTVINPAGATTNPSVTNASTGIYTALVPTVAIAAGTWFYTWSVSGTVTDVSVGTFATSADPASTYASVADLKLRVGATVTTNDARLADALTVASRAVDKACGRSFAPDLTATARVYEPCSEIYVDTDDFWTTTDLVVKVDTAADGTYASTIAAAAYDLRPLNGIVDGETGWPYNRICAVNSVWPTSWQRAPIQVTARWGWAEVPSGVREGTLILAEEIFKLADSPFGVGGYGQYGVIRARENPNCWLRIAPYARHPFLVA